MNCSKLFLQDPLGLRGTVGDMHVASMCLPELFSRPATSGLELLFSWTQRDTQLIFSLASPSGPGLGHT